LKIVVVVVSAVKELKAFGDDNDGNTKIWAGHTPSGLTAVQG